MNKLQIFVVWLDGFTDGKKEIDQKDTYIIKKKLNSLFTHVAEHFDIEYNNPTIEDLGKEHGFPVKNDNDNVPGSVGSDGGVWRC